MHSSSTPRLLICDRIANKDSLVLLLPLFQVAHPHTARHQHHGCKLPPPQVVAAVVVVSSAIPRSGSSGTSLYLQQSQALHTARHLTVFKCVERNTWVSLLSFACSSVKEWVARERARARARETEREGEERENESLYV